tara:strand:- start:273 stop:458 length:186 start_codon:yes stop_codon:yes gene_type:complete
MLKPFKITKRHLKEFEELDTSDIGLFAIRVSEEQDLMIYESMHIANKAYEYFSKNFKPVKK